MDHLDGKIAEALLSTLTADQLEELLARKREMEMPSPRPEPMDFWARWSQG